MIPPKTQSLNTYYYTVFLTNTTQKSESRVTRIAKHSLLTEE